LEVAAEVCPSGRRHRGTQEHLAERAAAEAAHEPVRAEVRRRRFGRGVAAVEQPFDGRQVGEQQP
jgi:hypothetical protein